MKLGEKQRVFSQTIAQFILWCYEQGYEVSLGDAYRDPRLHGASGVKMGYGHAKSCHKLRLAVDLNLFTDSVPGVDDDIFQASTEAHKPLGEKWKSMHELARWGGDFSTPDGNHYSFEHEGQR